MASLSHTHLQLFLSICGATSLIAIFVHHWLRLDFVNSLLDLIDHRLDLSVSDVFREIQLPRKLEQFLAEDIQATRLRSFVIKSKLRPSSFTNGLRRNGETISETQITTELDGVKFTEYHWRTNV